MSEWWTYRPGDFLMFSPATYRRLFELYNAEWWPWQMVPFAAGIGLAVSVAMRKRVPSQTVALGLAACWLWIAWAFHVERYASIHLAAQGFAAAFALQAALLALLASRASVQQEPRGGSLALLLVALAWPAIGVLLGQSWRGAEGIGFAPDPTAIATLAVLMLARGPIAWVLRAIPLAWCVVSGTTLATMDDAQAWLLFGAALATLVASVRGRDS